MHGRHASVRAVGNVSMLVVIGIYATFWYTYHFACKPVLLWAFLFNVPWFMAVWSYLRTCLTDPGTPSSLEWKQWASTRSEEDERRTRESTAEDADEEERTPWRRRTFKPGTPTYCKKCPMERPERAHHCNHCNVCILRMDHHCPWIGSCVGFRNHKFFVLMNLWSLLASVAFLTTADDLGMMVLLTVSPRPGDSSGKAGALALICSILALAFSLITGGMLIHSVWMMSRNSSSVEETFLGKNPYCHPSSIENIQQIVGPINLWLLVPVPPVLDASPERPAGTSFPLFNLLVADSADAAEQGTATGAGSVVQRIKSGYGSIK